MSMRCDVGPGRCVRTLLAAFVLFGVSVGGGVSGACAADPGELQIEITKKGLGKEVVITQGTREWFLMVEVTPENTVIVRQEKDHDKYLVDESETHDRSMSPAEVDAAIIDFVNSVKTRQQSK